MGEAPRGLRRSGGGSASVTGASPVTDEELKDSLQEVVGARLAPGAEILALRRSRTRDAGWCVSDLVSLRLANAKSLDLVVKIYGAGGSAQHEMAQRRERERCVYRELLAEEDLGTASCYGSVWDPERGRFWLVLEFVPGVHPHRRDAHHLAAAAGWLARMQARFASRLDPLLVRCPLIRHDEAFFRAHAGGARRAMARTAPRLAARLEKVLEIYEPLIPLLAHQAVTLVNGSFHRQKILVGPSAGPLRVCPLDWDLCGLGSPLYDLAFLSNGCRPPTLDRMWDAYRDEVGKSGGGPPDLDEMKYFVSCFQLHKLLKSLGEAPERRIPALGLMRRVEAAERLGRRPEKDGVHQP